MGGPNLLFGGDGRPLERWETSELIDKQAAIARAHKRVQENWRKPRRYESGYLEALRAIEAELQRR